MCCVPPRALINVFVRDACSLYACAPILFIYIYFYFFYFVALPAVLLRNFSFDLAAALGVIDCLLLLCCFCCAVLLRCVAALCCCAVAVLMCCDVLLCCNLLL